VTSYEPKGFAGCFAYEQASGAAVALGANFIWQEKIDGERAVLRLSPSGCTWHGRAMQSKPISLKSETSAVLDCEKVGDTFRAFDLLELKGEDISGQPLAARLAKLATLNLPHEIAIVPHYSSPDAIKEPSEGVVAKDLRSTYHQPNDWLRFKREITEDVIIASVDEDAQSVAVSRMVKGRKIPAGRIFGFGEVEIRQAAASIGAWIEIKAMQLTAAGKYRHGRFVRFRFDKGQAC